MKLLFTDLDGTLLDDEKNISQTDMASIQAMIGAGHKFVMTTGRPLTSVKHIAEKYGASVFLDSEEGKGTEIRVVFER